MNDGVRIAVFGAGRMGTVMALDLCRRAEVEAVTLVDLRADALGRASRQIGSKKLATRRLDVLGDPKGTVELLAEHGAAAVAMPRRDVSYALLDAAIAAGTSVVDILEEYHRRPDVEETEGLGPGVSGEELHRRAAAAGIAWIAGMGFEPGLANVTAEDGLRRLAGCERIRVRVRVGGNPAPEIKDAYPLSYLITWSFDHVLREYCLTTEIKQRGRIRSVEAAEGVERLRFPRAGRRVEFEAAVTPGMPSFLPTRGDRVYEFDAKTIRWPGHWAAVREFKRSGLLSEEKIAVADGDGPVEVAPRDLLKALLEPKLTARDGERDLCVLQTTVEGTAAGRRRRRVYRLWVEGDGELSAMAKVTAYPAAAAAAMLARGEIAARGIVAPEEALDGPLFERLLAELADPVRGVEVVAQDE